MAGSNHTYQALDPSGRDFPLNPPNYADVEGNTSGSTASHNHDPLDPHTADYQTLLHNASDDDDNDDTFVNEQDPNERSNPEDRTLPSHGIEQFEIDDMFDDDEPGQREGFFVRASLMTKKFASRFNNNIIHPVSRIVDPIYETYKHFQMQYERSITKLGNPLVVKRLFYVFFVMMLIFFITKYDTSDGVNGTSGGAFSTGRFYDIDKLSSSVKGYIDPKLMKENLEYLSSMPHITGSKGDLVFAKYIEKFMQNNGIRILDFNELQSFTNYPVSNEKETYVKLSDDSFQAELFELHSRSMEFLAYNPNSLNTNEEIESFYVYANFGTPKDLKTLKDKNIELKDSILLVKYGGQEGNSVPEANKVRIAQDYGVKAIIFISPKFEVGSEVHDDIIQRENVGLTRVSPGDILTPGWSSEDGYVARLPWFKSEITPKVPSIPISWKDGAKLISKLDNSGIKFEDGLYSGDGKSNVGSDRKIKLRISHETRPTHQIWNVVGSIKGREQPEKGIIIGSARDASCYGTMGTNTGTVILLELVKIFTSLQRQYKWSPSRSIYFVSFDATEYNLAGSAEWIENRKESLKKEGYAYIDLSDVVSGDVLDIKSHPFFEEVIKDALKKIDLEDDKDHKTLYDLFKSTNNNNDKISNNMIESKNYLPFINMINMPSMEIKFSGKKYPKNSCYDNFENFENSKIDPVMTKHKQLVELLSVIALNLAEAPIIPYNFYDFAFKLSQMEKDLERYSNEIKSSMDQSKAPNLEFGELRKSVAMLKELAGVFHDYAAKWKQFVAESAGVEPSVLAMNRWKWHDNLLRYNEGFISQTVAKDRPGYVNVLLGVPFHAPEDFISGHEWNSFPVIRDYLANHDFRSAQNEINELAKTIEFSSRHLLDT